jgi:hypothetical protein
MVKVNPALYDHDVGVLDREEPATKKPVRKPMVPRKERPPRLMLNGAKIDTGRLRKPIVDV